MRIGILNLKRKTYKNIFISPSVWIYEIFSEFGSNLIWTLDILQARSSGLHLTRHARCVPVGVEDLRCTKEPAVIAKYVKVRSFLLLLLHPLLLLLIR